MGTVDGRNPFLRGTFCAVRCFVEEFCKGTVKLIENGDINLASVVVPIKSRAKVQCASPVNGELVMVFDGVDEVLSIGFGEIFYSRVVNLEN